MDRYGQNSSIIELTNLLIPLSFKFWRTELFPMPESLRNESSIVGVSTFWGNILGMPFTKNRSPDLTISSGLKC